MSNLTTLKASVLSFLSKKVSITKHTSANNLMMDYLYIPFGVIFPYAGSKVPPNCVFCDNPNATYDKDAYPYLFEAIGFTYGGDNVQNFKIPYIPAGCSIIQKGTVETTFSDDSSVPTYNLGATGGKINHKLTINEMATHSHKMFTNRDASQGGTVIAYEQPNWPVVVQDTGAGNDNYKHRSYNEPLTNITLGPTSETGLNSPMTVMNPYIAMNHIIRLR